MSHVLVVTVGTSALTAKDLKDNLPPYEGKRLGEDIQGYLDAEAEEKAFIAIRDNLQSRVLNAHRVFWATKPRSFRRCYRSSAEMMSCKVLLAKLDSPVDRVLLLASHTHEGELAAEINKLLLREYLFAPQLDPSISCERVDELKTVREDFGTLFETLTTILSRYSRARDKLVFNFTGGFKGLIPALTWIAEHRFPGAPMFYVHADMTAAAIIHFPEPPAGVPGLALEGAQQRRETLSEPEILVYRLEGK